MGQLVIARKPIRKSKTGLVHPYHIKPAKTVPNFGVELEMGLEWDDSSYTGFHKGAFAEIERRVGGYFSWHEDCGALEIVSAPLNFNEIRLYLKTLLETPILGQKRVKGNQHGMHVHYGNKFMSGSHLERVLRFILNQDSFNRQFMRFIAGRATTDSAEWAYLPSFERFIREYIYDYFDEGWQNSRSERLGIAINTRHQTHEFRLFATTNSADRACANVEFVAALGDLFRSRDSVTYQTDTAKFISLVKANADIYPHLAAHISKKYK